MKKQKVPGVADTRVALRTSGNNMLLNVAYVPLSDEEQKEIDDLLKLSE